MRDIHVAGKSIQLDEEGFLVNQEDWNHDAARGIAKNAGIGALDDDQMEIMNSCESIIKNSMRFRF
jgi:sulfur relay (sulfurtransferase) DsrC/TusE family protein